MAAICRIARGQLRTAIAPRRQLSTATGAAMFKGVWPIMATPFHPDTEEVDLQSFGKCVAFMKAAKCDGITITGVLGESNRLLDHEREALIKTAVREADGMPICVGTSHAGTYATKVLSQMAEELGAAAVMVTPTKEGVPLADDRMLEYYSKVAEGINISIVLQDHPASTMVHMSVPLLARLVNEIPSIACVKLESLPTPPRITALKSLMERDCSILTGLGALYGLYDIDSGIEGFMTGFAFPEVLKAIVEADKAGNREEVRRIYQHWLPLMVFEQQPGVAVRKELYRLRGIVTDGYVRHPAPSITPGPAMALARAIEDTAPGIDITKPLPLQSI